MAEVYQAVVELERQVERERARADRAEGIVLLYETREQVATIARTYDAKSNRWRIEWKRGDDEPVSFTFSPGLWLLGLAEGYLRHPEPFELRVIDQEPPETKGGGESA